MFRVTLTIATEDELELYCDGRDMSFFMHIYDDVCHETGLRQTNKRKEVKEGLTSWIHLLFMFKCDCLVEESEFTWSGLSHFRPSSLLRLINGSSYVTKSSSLLLQ